jgi:epoxyqueuosine reductase
LDAQKLSTAIRAQAQAQGFDACRFTAAALPELTGMRLEEAVLDGRHATMEWMAETLPRRRDPRAMWPHARSAIVLGMNYGPDHDPLEILEKRDRGAISVYAQNRDYHDVIKGRLKHVAQAVAALTGGEVKVFVDTAPLMEKPLAAQAGIGWQGKHTNLVSREFGSWLFLGVILTQAHLPPDAPEVDHCGNCRACLDICPTDAFPQPYQLDARRCISYLTIEHKGPVPHEFRAAIGNRIYGCDDCLAVCPWNKFASTAREAKLQARADLTAPPLAQLAALDDAAFRAHFSGSPVKRIGRNRFVRNVLIAIGNSGDASLIGAAAPHLRDPDPLVRGAAVWALSRLADRAELLSMRASLPPETDDGVALEWQLALEGPSRVEEQA